MYLKKPLQPSQVMALKWKPVALSPHTPQIRGTFLSNSSGGRVDVLTTVGSITAPTEENEEKKTGEQRKQMLETFLACWTTEYLKTKPWKVHLHFKGPFLVFISGGCKNSTKNVTLLSSLVSMPTQQWPFLQDRFKLSPFSLLRWTTV